MMLAYGNKRKKIQLPYLPDTLYTFNLAGDITARIQLNTKLQENHINSLNAHIPGIVQTQKRAESTQVASDNVVFTHIEGDETDLIIDHKDRIVLTAPWKDKISPDFIHIFYGAARLAWLSKNLCPVHGACVGAPGKSNVLIVGSAGVGKTSATLSCTLTKNYQMFSGDKTIVDVNGYDKRMVAVGGTPVLTIRESDINKWQEYKLNFEKSGDRFQGKLPEQYQYKNPNITIHNIVLLRLNDGSEKFEEITGIRKLHELIPYFIDTERADVYIGNADTMLDGNISKETKLEISNNLLKTLENVRVFILVGSLQSVTDKISKLVEEQPKQRLTNNNGK
jgi:hypothetical protein